MTTISSTVPSVTKWIQEGPKMWIGNAAVNSDETFEVLNPWNDNLVAKVPKATRQQVQNALEGAHSSTFDLSPAQRSQILHRTANHFRDHADEVARLITAESGLSLQATRYEVNRSINVLKAGAEWTLRYGEKDWTAPYQNGTLVGKAELEVIADPVSLAVSITPFNHPLNQVVHKVVPAIAAGVCHVLKPSEKTPLVALYLAQVLAGYGLPAHALNVITGDPEEIVPQLTGYSGLEVLSFTGSVRIGKLIARQMVANGNELARYIPELGGNAAFVILDDADLDLAVKVALGAFDNSGQRCTAIKRILVHREIAAEFTAQFLKEAQRLTAGDPLDPTIHTGTVIDEAAARQLESRVDAALSSGAQLLWGHKRRGALYPPTVLSQVRPDMELVTEESFGPIAPIIEIDSLEEAIDIVNRSRFKLAGAIATASESKAREYAAAIRVGQFSWNGPPGYRTEEAPFGGFGDSGNGEKEGIISAIKNFYRLRTFYTH